MSKIQKILSLGPKEWLTGLSPTYAYSGRGVIAETTELTPLPGIRADGGSGTSNYFLGSLRKLDSYLDQVSTTDTQVDLVVKTTGASTATIYSLGSSGHFYTTAVTSNTTLGTPSDKRSGTPITNPAKALALYKPQGGTEYAYYWQTTQIGQWDLSGVYAAGWTDNHFTGLQSTAFHFKHEFAGDIYYTNKDRLGKIYDNAGTVANNTNVLDFPSDFVATALENDGEYLAVAIAKNPVANQTIATENRVLFWDTFSPSWLREWKIYDLPIAGMKRVDNMIYFMCGYNIYACNFNTEPQLIHSGDGYNYVAMGSANTLMRFADGALFSADVATLYYVGKVPGIQSPVLHSFGVVGPYYAIGQLTGAGIVVADFSHLLSYTLGTPTINSGSADLYTVDFDLEAEYRIHQVDLTFAEALSDSPADDTVKIYLNTVLWGTASYTVHGAVKRVELKNTDAPVTTQFLTINVRYNGGYPVLKTITIYGERLSDFN